MGGWRKKKEITKDARRSEAQRERKNHHGCRHHIMGRFFASLTGKVSRGGAVDCEVSDSTREAGGSDDAPLSSISVNVGW